MALTWASRHEATLPPTQLPDGNQWQLTSARINAIGQLNDARRYLEVGVFRGETFRAVDCAHRCGVDPDPKFDVAAIRNAATEFHVCTSDVFFTTAAAGQFDTIFLDGLHTFEQTLRDFLNSLSCAHARTVWLIDDTWPSDCASALPSLAQAGKFRALTNDRGTAWHGDVFKLIFALHDFFPMFDWRTVIDRGNPQTILVRAPRPDFQPRWNDLATISTMGYTDFVLSYALLNPCTEAEALAWLSKTLAPQGPVTTPAARRSGADQKNEQIGMKLSLVMMQKNEGRLLEAWVRYHELLTPASNILVLDNGSTEAATLTALADAAARGVRVDRRYSRADDFGRKREIIMEAIAALQAEGSDFVVPLDCDEFLTCCRHGKPPSAYPEDVLECLAELQRRPGHFRLRGALFNLPGETLRFVWVDEEGVFFGRSPVADVDLGFHRARTSDGTPAVGSDLTVLHFQNKRPEVAKVHAVEKLKRRVRDFSRDTLEVYRGQGAHLRRWFLPEAGFTWPAQAARPVVGFDEILRRTGIDFPFEMFLTTDRYVDLRARLESTGLFAALRSEWFSEDEALAVCRSIDPGGRVFFGAPSIVAEMALALGARHVTVASLMNGPIRDALRSRLGGRADEGSPIEWRDIDLGVRTDQMGNPDGMADSEAVRGYVDALTTTDGPGPLYVVNNGRYRMAVAAAAALAAVQQPVVIAFATFWSRPQYHAALQFCDCIGTEGDVAILRPNHGLDVATLSARLSDFLLDAR